MAIAALAILCVVSLYTDIKSRLIPNVLTLPVIVFGFIYHAFSGWDGLIFSAGGMFLGAGLLIIPYLSGGMGGGDVKFMAAAGAVGGPAFILEAFIYSSVIGGIIATGLMLKDGIFFKFIKEFLLFLFWYPVIKLKITGSESTLPYAVCLSTGVAMAMLI